MKYADFWAVTQSGFYKNRRFGRKYRLHHQEDKNWRARNNVSSNLSHWWWRRDVPPKHRFLHEPCAVTSQKTAFFIVIREDLKSYIALTGWALQRRRNESPVKYELDFYIPVDGIVHSHHRGNLKSYIALAGGLCSGDVMCLLWSPDKIFISQKTTFFKFAVNSKEGLCFGPILSGKHNCYFAKSRPSLFCKWNGIIQVFVSVWRILIADT
jgi:hypothetical protein